MLQQLINSFTFLSFKVNSGRERDLLTTVSRSRTHREDLVLKMGKLLSSISILTQLFFILLLQNIGPRKGNGVRAQHYMNLVLIYHIQPYFQQQATANDIFQQDNPQPLTASHQCLFAAAKTSLSVLQFSESGLNPIMHHRDIVQRGLNQI